MSNVFPSWGRYPHWPQKGACVAWPQELTSVIHDLASRHGHTLAYGNGRSYGDSCLAQSAQVVSMASLDRFIEVDWTHGTITAEAGVTLAQILELAIPRGWFLPVTPGTQYVTLGGAIANDVHGKNHHVRGTFGGHVLQFGLVREQQAMTCSAQQNPLLYQATIGGLGLTGVIAWAQLQLVPITSSQIDGSMERFANLGEFFALSTELDSQHEYSVAWIDCLAKGKDAGRGVFIVGDHAKYGTLEAGSHKKLNVPLTPPISLINNLSLRGFNEAYWRKHPRTRTPMRSHYEPFFYPLDKMLNWNRIYGRKGFQQYQCVIPDANAATAMPELLEAIAQSGQGSFLAVLKCCGEAVSPGLLSFPMPGTSLALDFPNSANLPALFERLDSIVRAARGRLYPAKDAHMSGSDFRAAYPQWEQLERLRDPSILSRLWKRVTE